MKKSSLFLTGAGIVAFALLLNVGVLQAQDMTSSTGDTLLPPPPPPIVETTSTHPTWTPTSTHEMPPVPTLFTNQEPNDSHSTSTEMRIEHPTSTRPMMPPMMQGGQINQDENVVVSSDDSAAVRAAKLARYWSLYREIGSNSIFAITTSGTKREIQTLTFFTGVDANFGIKLVAKGTLDQFTTVDPITSIEGLDPSQFRKAPQPCRLIKTTDHPAVYLACLGMKRLIINEKAFHQFNWDFKHVQTVASTELNTLKAGDNVTDATVFDQGVTIDTSGVKQEKETPKPSTTKPTTMQPQSTAKVNGITSTKGARIVKLQSGSKIYILTADGQKHLLTNMDVVRALKLNLDNVQTMTQDQLNVYPDGTPITLGTGGKEPSPSAKATGDRLSPAAPMMTPPVPGTSSSTRSMSPPPTLTPLVPPSTEMPLNPAATSSTEDQTGTDLTPPVPPTMPNTL